MTKNELRKAALARLSVTALSAAARHRASEAICREIKSHPAWPDAELVCAFLPLPSEPQISKLWDGKGGPTFCFPRLGQEGLELIRPDDRELLGRADWRLSHSEFDLAPIVAPESVDLFLVPGLAFTPDGRRLGRGGGYYDRLLPQRADRSTALGLCFAVQLMDQLPVEAHDQSVDAVLTECGLARTL